MAKYLIVNADDCGMCHSANKAVFELFEGGFIKSSTIMMPCPAAKEAVEYAAQHPEFAFGVHTTLTNEWDSHRWKPLTAGKTLVGEDGYMWRTSEQVEKNASYADIEAEVRAQIELAHSLGMKPSHVDNHMGTLYGHYTGRFGLGKLALRLCGEYGYSYRFFTKYDKRIAPEGIPRWLYQGITLLTKIWGKRYKTLMPDYLLFPDWTDDLRVSYEHYRETILKIWADIPDGITETFVHPALETDELKSIVGLWRDRVWEYQLMKDPYTHRFLKEHGVELINYRDLERIKGKK